MKTKNIKFTKREAEVVMGAIDLAVKENGVPDCCEKCFNAFWSAVEKLDTAFDLGVMADESEDVA